VLLFPLSLLSSSSLPLFFSHLPHAHDRVQGQDEQDDGRLHKGGNAFLRGRAVDEGQDEGDGGRGEEDL